MSRDQSNHGERPGPIAYMASNSVAANLLMFGILAARAWWRGPAWSRKGGPRSPSTSSKSPCATPEEVEEAIVVKIEDEVRGDWPT